ncbi:hypothetical protein B4U79_13928 [Dinothrombium tinctorium]|uniref:EF-hand domain-containing protein n=1 Tax=Dinothrombium tinctorium TaxID=1965070 RepID=A0A3S3QKU4_9ACAR|nr:hypothetical protein B4U79_13928 [Dinothrombium tinctorium]
MYLNLFSTLLVPVISLHLAFSHSSDEEMHQDQIPPPVQQPSSEVIQNELKTFFRRMDKNLDKLLSAEEVKLWMQHIHDKIINDNVDRQWKYYEPEVQEVHSWFGYKPEKMEALTWEKYRNTTYPQNVYEENENETDENIKGLRVMYKRAERRWILADTNNDTLLIKQEFVDFIHPEESQVDKVREVLVLEAKEDMDSDGNDEVSFEEYMTHIKSMAHEEERNDDEWLKVQQNHFSYNLDKDKDNALNFEELKEWLIPSEDRHESEGKRLISLADENNDEKLSEEELSKGYENFLSLLPPEFWEKYNTAAEYATETAKHDEF